MAEKFRAKPDRLHAAAPEFDRIGAEAADILRRLRDAVDLTGRPWGGDDTGRAFAETYCPDEAQALGDLDDLTRALQQTGDELRAVTGVFESVDLVSARAVLQPDTAPTELAPPQQGTPLHAVDRAPDSARPVTGAPAASRSANPARTPNLPGAIPEPSNPVADNATAPTPSPDRLPGEAMPARSTTGPMDTRAADAPNTVTSRTGAARPTPAGRLNTRQTPGPWIERSAAARDDRTTVSRTGADQASATATTKPGKPSPWSTATGGRPLISTRATSDTPPRLPGPIAPRQPDRIVRPSRPDDAVADESLAARLVGELAERYGVRGFGFDTPGIPDEVLIEVAAAVGDLLPRYPMIGLSAIGFGELPDLVHHDGFPHCPRITLSYRAATAPADLHQLITDAEQAGLFAAGCAERPVYSLVVRELGALLDSIGAHRARTGAQRALITAYLSQADPHEKYSLRRTVTGYRRWRAQLPGRSFHGRQLDPGPALSEAFTGVVLAPGRAAPPAHVLSHLLVAGAEQSADTGQGIRPV
ncbi:WXG100 family type VII secretion target [Nocardia jinanensis]|uniref:Uncharacterized protein n=1 Tax=Nocardia jinanensis TaxID=382504 RepID=A0A917RHF5_9NOCA|nr:WXG100 family type VII secretion target [Nocardia jinanensis]GGL06364.1 hypothetical protein GCM10011588_21060 [Nocardia jinanensis]